MARSDLSGHRGAGTALGQPLRQVQPLLLIYIDCICSLQTTPGSLTATATFAAANSHDEQVVLHFKLTAVAATNSLARQ